MLIAQDCCEMIAQGLVSCNISLHNNTKHIWVLDFRHNITVLPEPDPITCSNGQPSSPSITRLRAIACK